MTTDEQIRALLAMDDEKRIERMQFMYQCSRENIPYLTQYDAIIPLIQKQSPIGMTQFIDFSCEKILDDHYDGSDYISQVDIGTLFRATPAQLAESLLRETSKWKN